MYNNSVEEGKSAAIISYFWWLGLLIAFIMNNNKRNYFTAFHIRQSLGISIILFVLSLLVKFGIPFFATILFLGVFVLWVMGLLSAIKGEEKPIPLVGELFQNWFRNI